MSFSFTPYLAKGYAAILGNPKAKGQIYHLNSMEYATMNSLYQTLEKIINVEPKILHISTDLLYASKMKKNGHLYYEKQYISLFDSTKGGRDLGFKPFTIKGGLKWRETGNDQGENENIDRYKDRLVELYYQWEKDIRENFPS